jgi:hypothetical protein
MDYFLFSEMQDIQGCCRIFVFHRWKSKMYQMCPRHKRVENGENELDHQLKKASQSLSYVALPR